MGNPKITAAENRNCKHGHSCDECRRSELTAGELTVNDLVQIVKDLEVDSGAVYTARLGCDGAIIQAQPEKTEVLFSNGIVLTIPAKKTAADAGKQVFDFIQAGIAAGRRLAKIDNRRNG